MIIIIDQIIIDQAVTPKHMLQIVGECVADSGSFTGPPETGQATEDTEARPEGGEHRGQRGGGSVSPVTQGPLSFFFLFFSCSFPLAAVLFSFAAATPTKPPG